MNEKFRTIDARGLACPGPVIETKKALEAGGFESLEVIVDNAAAKENVSRFAAYSSCAIESINESDGCFHIVMRPSREPQPSTGSVSAELPSTDDKPHADTALTVFISSEYLGRGPEELGAILMKGYLFALAESEKPPKRIVLMNSGVRLVVEGSPSLENLRRLKASGVEIVACGTCLDYFKVKEKLAVGRISNMYEISEFLAEGRTLTL
jgi:selenium metabolism protein YedF